MLNFKKITSIFVMTLGVVCLFFAINVQAETLKPDLTVTDITFSGTQKGQAGVLSVKIKNLGDDLNDTAGLLNWYNNFSAQNFVFSNPTPSILQFKTDRDLPGSLNNNPLETNETITFYWHGSFNTQGNLYLHFTVDNANELAELNENNNTFSNSILITEGSQAGKPDLKVTNITFSNNLINQLGTINVTIKNVGTKSLSSATGLLNGYFNLADQSPDWQFSSETPAVSSKTNRPLPSVSYPLAPGESISRLWLGKFVKAGNYYLHYIVDNGDELDESDENNNSFSTIVTLEDLNSGSSSNSNIVIADEPEVVKPGSSYSSQASNLNKVEQLLAEINSLRNIIQEQANEIKYLKSLTQGVNISTDAKNTLNNFITYGTDENTKKLGAGERAAVIHSYKNAFDKLPTTDNELTDVIKIANGRWPSVTSAKAENQAKGQFEKIYKRTANMDKPNENAAVTVMSYGLRQKAENRNLNSEVAGIKIFTNIYGHAPQTTEDWNIMQAITYSGVSR